MNADPSICCLPAYPSDTLQTVEEDAYVRMHTRVLDHTTWCEFVYHAAKDYKDEETFLIATPTDLVVLQPNVVVKYNWCEIAKIYYNEDQFCIKLKEHIHAAGTIQTFKMASNHAAKALWQSSVKELKSVSPGIGSKIWKILKRLCVRSTEAEEKLTPLMDWHEVNALRVPTSDYEYLELGIPCLRFRSSSLYCSDSSSVVDDGSLGVCIQLLAGPDGLFGFNVRGGSGAPVYVSSVCSEAAQQLQEGDQVTSINGTEVDELTHEQVVQLIRNTSGVLTLTIKPYVNYDQEETGSAE